VGFYNCRIEPGSSQPCRHIQFIPVPSSEEFLFFPDKPVMQNQLAKQSFRAFPTLNVHYLTAYCANPAGVRSLLCLCKVYTISKHTYACRDQSNRWTSGSKRYLLYQATPQLEPSVPIFAACQSVNATQEDRY
jgi:ATP adenylyltransferase/5',5'''-P-1,P-4-tetraphosphate phosphorylase II